MLGLARVDARDAKMALEIVISRRYQGHRRRFVHAVSVTELLIGARSPASCRCCATRRAARLAPLLANQPAVRVEGALGERQVSVCLTGVAERRGA